MVDPDLSQLGVLASGQPLLARGILRRHHGSAHGLQDLLLQLRDGLAALVHADHHDPSGSRLLQLSEDPGLRERHEEPCDDLLRRRDLALLIGKRRTRKTSGGAFGRRRFFGASLVHKLAESRRQRRRGGIAFGRRSRGGVGRSEKLMRKIILALALMGVLGPVASLAQQNDDLLVSTAREWGGDNGVFTCDQWRGYMTKLYRLADPKKRGYIDEKSFAVIPRTSSVFASASFDYFDEAGKGRVTK